MSATERKERRHLDTLLRLERALALLCRNPAYLPDATDEMKSLHGRSLKATRRMIEELCRRLLRGYEGGEP